MGTLMSYVQHLSEIIGPRPATTDAEERAAHYIRDAFHRRGMDAELESFDSPRTYSWAYVLYHLATIFAAVGSRWFPLAALVLAAVTAVLMWLDLDTRFGLTSLMPKGPSQNVVARHVPRVGRGERIAKVVIVAHYDSARTSLAFSPGMVKSFSATFGLMKACTFLVPVLILVRMLPVVDDLEPWAWYVTSAVAAYLLVPMLINVHRELFMRFSPGANDNASGVAVMLGLLERLVPETETVHAGVDSPMRSRSAEEVWEADVLPEGSLLAYAPVGEPDPVTWADEDDDIAWDTGVISGQTALGLDRQPSVDAPVSSTERGSYARSMEAAREAEDDRGSLSDRETMKRLFGTAPSAAEADAPELELDFELDDEALAAPPVGTAAPVEDVGSSGKHGLFGLGRKSQGSSEKHGVRDWLGVGNDFDARKKGRDIGSWDNFGDDEEDEAGWKGGAASIPADEEGHTASIAARIRRRVTMNVDRELVEKEVWFVATGSEEVGTVGMKAFLARHGHELADAAIVNLDNLGAGALTFVIKEGMARRYPADRRLLSAARRAVRESGLPVKAREYKGLSTDATPALARGYRAMSIMAFDINGRLPNWHWSTDTTDQVSEQNLETAVDFVSALIKEI